VEKKEKVLQLHHHASFLASLIIAMDKPCRCSSLRKRLHREQHRHPARTPERFDLI
jgi:hypothetical protein